MGGVPSKKRALSSEAKPTSGVLSIISASRKREYDETNGVIFTTGKNRYFIPNEVLTHILSYVDPISLGRNCVLVCQNWNNLIKYNVWRTLAERKLNKRFGKLPWKAYQSICMSDAFNKNLIKNPCGEQKMKYWRVLKGTHDWFIEVTPNHFKLLPENEFGEIITCYATSSRACAKYQTVNLMEEGISPEVMDLMQPKIYVSEWVGSRFQFGCVYELLVTLLNSEKYILKRFNYRFKEGRFHGGIWHKVEHTFENYGRGVRYIYFFHGGQETGLQEVWESHCGCKMSNATVKVLFDFSKMSEKKSDNKECDDEVLVVKENIHEFDNTLRNLRYPWD